MQSQTPAGSPNRVSILNMPTEAEPARPGIGQRAVRLRFPKNTYTSDIFHTSPVAHEEASSPPRRPHTADYPWARRRNPILEGDNSPSRSSPKRLNPSLMSSNIIAHNEEIVVPVSPPRPRTSPTNKHGSEEEPWRPGKRLTPPSADSSRAGMPSSRRAQLVNVFHKKIFQVQHDPYQTRPRGRKHFLERNASCNILQIQSVEEWKKTVPTPETHVEVEALPWSRTEEQPRPGKRRVPATNTKTTYNVVDGEEPTKVRTGKRVFPKPAQQEPQPPRDVAVTRVEPSDQHRSLYYQLRERASRSNPALIDFRYDKPFENGSD